MTKMTYYSASEASHSSGERFGVYCASRASLPARVEMWQNFRASGALLRSSWIDESGPGQTLNLSELWLKIHAEITSSLGLILYVERNDFPLKGALIEVGIALGLGLTIRIVSPGISLDPISFRPLGSWVQHPLVRFSESIESAYADLINGL